jgi:phosphoglycerate dehydrogenase-like enzyme
MTRPVIASSLPAAFNDGLAAHCARPRVVALTGAPWDVPPEAQALFTYQSQWRIAPAAPPRGWPFGLCWIQVASAGVDTLPDWVHAVPLITRAAGAHAPAIAEYVIGAVFAHEKRIARGAVASPLDWRPEPRGRIVGKRLGVAGLGEIGRETARLGIALGMEVAAVSRSGRPMGGVRLVDAIEALLAWADHLVLALPLTPATRGVIDANALASARRGLHLINIARGALIDDAALIAALDGGQLAAATLDVTEPEPPPAGHPFYSHPAIRLTPHISGAVEDSDARMIAAILANFGRWLDGEPLRGVIDRQAGY